MNYKDVLLRHGVGSKVDPITAIGLERAAQEKLVRLLAEAPDVAKGGITRKVASHARAVAEATSEWWLLGCRDIDGVLDAAGGEDARHGCHGSMHRLGNQINALMDCLTFIRIAEKGDDPLQYRPNKGGDYNGTLDGFLTTYVIPELTTRTYGIMAAWATSEASREPREFSDGFRDLHDSIPNSLAFLSDEKPVAAFLARHSENTFMRFGAGPVLLNLPEGPELVFTSSFSVGDKLDAVNWVRKVRAAIPEWKELRITVVRPALTNPGASKEISQVAAMASILPEIHSDGDKALWLELITRARIVLLGSTWGSELDVLVGVEARLDWMQGILCRALSSISKMKQASNLDAIDDIAFVATWFVQNDFAKPELVSAARKALVSQGK